MPRRQSSSLGNAGRPWPGATTHGLPSRNSSGASSARYRRQTIHVWAPDVSFTENLTPFSFSQPSNLRCDAMMRSSVPHASQISLNLGRLPPGM